jgi:hypothetical protein
MSYSEFTFQKIESELNLTIEEMDIFSETPSVEISNAFDDLLKENIPLALAINTEKARSELLIAPVLVEFRRMLKHRVSLFSGVEFNVDAQKGLNGVCDYIISASSRQILMTAPIINIVEAKNENIKSGIPQCLSEMYAAKLFNTEKGTTVPYIYGIVTTGSSWKFMYLQENRVTIDSMEYFIDNIQKIMGILIYMTKQDGISEKSA